jgi:hypothetical protein
MRPHPGNPHFSLRRLKRHWTIALLVTFIAVQPWATCPVLCLVQGHTTVSQTHHHHHVQPCHDGSQVQNQRPSFDVAGDMIASSWTPGVVPHIHGTIPAGPAILGRPQTALSAEPPPPRRA